MSAETESNKADTETKAEAANASAPEEEAPELEPSPDGPPPPPPIKKRSAPPPPADEEQPVSVSGRLPAAEWPPKTLADLMTRQVITLKEKEPIGDLEGWMKRFRFRHLPVVDEHGLCGMITIGDLLAHEVGEHEATIEYLSAYIHGPRG